MKILSDIAYKLNCVSIKLKIKLKSKIDSIVI